MRTKKAAINFFFSLLLQIATFITGLILPKVIIIAYGSTMNGLISSIRQFISYLNLVEGGIATSATQALYKPLFENDKDKLSSMLSATHKFYFKTGLIFSALIAVMTIIYPLFISNNVSKLLTVLLILVISSVSLIEYFITGKYRVLLLADQKSHIISIAQMIGQILNTVVTVFLVNLKYGVLTVQISSTVVFITRIIIPVLYAKKKYPNLKYNVVPDYTVIDKRWDAFIHQLAGIVISGTPILLLTIFSTLTAVSIYSIYNMVFFGIGMVVSTFSNGLTSSFGEVFASGDMLKLKKAFSSYEHLYYSILTWGYTCTSILIIPFISLYTKGVKDADYVNPVIAALFIIIGIANNIRVPFMTLVMAAGHFRETRKQAIIEMLINVIASIILVQFIGIYGVLIGTVLSFAYRTLDFVWYGNNRILLQSNSRSLLRLIVNLLIGLLISVPSAIYISPLISSWVSWIIISTLIAVLTAIVIFGLGYIIEPVVTRDILNRIKIICGIKL